MPLPAVPTSASLPLCVSRREPKTPTQEIGAHNAALAPEYSLFICGRPRTITTTSTLPWVVGPPWNRQVWSTMLDLTSFPDSPITLFHYIAPEDTPASALPPPDLHKALNLTESKSAFLFVHDASDKDVNESMLYLRGCIELFHRYGGRGFWVVINTAGSTEKNGLRDVDSIAARFAEEFMKWPELDVFFHLETGPRVLKMPTEAAYCVVGDAMLKTPRLFAPRPDARPVVTNPGALSDQNFWSAFLNGYIVPWKHEDYLRAAYLTLVDPENRGLGLLDIATKFAADVNAFKQRYSQFQLLPESRTLTVFWLYHVELAFVSVRVHERRSDLARDFSFRGIFEYMPELRDHKLPTAYYSSDILKSEYAERFWMLPDLRPLIDPRRERDDEFKEDLVKKEREDPERLLRFVFAVVQRYLHPRETRRRSWFINFAFAAFQKQTIRLRTKQPWISVYSETQAYFYLQLVHAALLQLRAAGRNEYVQEMSYPLFCKMFNVTPSTWTAYYTEQLWNSLEARAGFLPPDIKPLPDTIQPSIATKEPAGRSPDPNLFFRRLGLIPELPSLETLHFHQAIVLDDAKALISNLDPTEVTTHAALLRYIHAHIVVPSLSAPPASTPPLICQHLTILSQASRLPTTHLTTVLTLTLHHLTTRFNTDYFPPTPPRPSSILPVGAPNTHGTRYRRAHNCPCHDGWESWVRGSLGLVICWEGVGKLEIGWLKGLGDGEGEGEETGVEDERGKKKDGKEESNRAKEGDARKETERHAQEIRKESNEEDDDDKTLAGAEPEDREVGDGGEEGDEWEVMSQHTLC
ncbi:hypothetical protein C8A05DRAFT_18327 [Staphylotrichum tortipilum]|uniref:Uncharacterized protein n=1 Tax=Staphylotrichum tortipilum TaxID=2831512 RepID=A0AAN6ME83_9PEZI|nr:hypothetical protein C8A05DRAFT_18327 [Staphylotrichum longicolle]